MRFTDKTAEKTYKKASVIQREEVEFSTRKSQSHTTWQPAVSFQLNWQLKFDIS